MHRGQAARVSGLPVPAGPSWTDLESADTMARMVWWLLTRSIAPGLAGVRGAPCVDDDLHARPAPVRRGHALNLVGRELHVDDSAGSGDRHSTPDDAAMSRRAPLTSAEADA